MSSMSSGTEDGGGDSGMAAEGDAQADVGKTERTQRFAVEQVGQAVRRVGAHGHGAKGGHA